MKILKVIDKYQDWKVWVIKIYGKGEVYFNQECYGRIMYHKFTRTTKRYLNELLERDINTIIANDEREDEPNDIMDREFNIINDHKDAYVNLFTKIHNEENNPYEEEELPF